MARSERRGKGPVTAVVVGAGHRGILGTHGEIEGEMETGVFHVRHADLHGSHGDREYTQEAVDVNAGADGHGGGDLRLVEDFVRVLRGQQPSLSTTHLEDSVYGALVGFAADQSRLTHRAVRVNDE